jgi:hypothetical protein
MSLFRPKKQLNFFKDFCPSLQKSAKSLYWTSPLKVENFRTCDLAARTFWDLATFALKHGVLQSRTLKWRPNYPRTLSSQFDFVHRWGKFPGKCDTLCSKCEFVLTPFALGLITYLFIQMQCIDFKKNSMRVVLNGSNFSDLENWYWMGQILVLQTPNEIMVNHFWL